MTGVRDIASVNCFDTGGQTGTWINNLIAFSYASITYKVRPLSTLLRQIFQVISNANLSPLLTLWCW